MTVKSVSPWYEIQDSTSYWEAFEQEQIVWGNLNEYPKFALVDGGTYLNAPAVTMVSNSKYLLGIMNSQIAEYFVSRIAAKRQGRAFEYKKMYVEQLAIPVRPKNEEISFLVTQILSAKQTNPSADTKNLEQKTDHLVYQLYDLTDEEVSMVEGATVRR